MNGIWLVFVVCAFVTVFVAVAASSLKAAGYAIGPEEDE